MRTVIRTMAFAAGLLALNVAVAQAPAGATGQCKDGSYTTNATKSGACSGHKGVKDWYAAKADAKTADAKASKADAKTADAKASKADAKAAKADAKASKAASSPAPAAAAAPASSAAAAPAAAPAASHASAPTKASTVVNTTPAPGGGAGKVWVNTATNVYHCQGTKYYGTTKAGSYMTEAEAQAKGAHGERGKPCK